MQQQTLVPSLFLLSLLPYRFFLLMNHNLSWTSQELKRFPTLQSDIAAAANESLERFREDGRKTVLRLVEMEASYLTVEFFRKLPTEPEKAADKNTPVSDRYQDNHLRRIGKYTFLTLFVEKDI